MNKNRCLTITIIAVTAVLILASSCATPANNQPIITSLEPERDRIAPLGSLQVVCTASDADGDQLSYIWSASAGEITGGGATVTWTAPVSEGSHNVTVKVVDGRGNEASDYVAITVRTNDAPSIASLTASAEWTTPSGSLHVTCTASDPDGDDLTYDWSAAAGNTSGTGAVVDWSAPQELGIYDITVVVTDSYGSSAIDSVSISVATGQPPIIEALLVTAEHCYLETFSWGCMVGREQEYDIECVIADATTGLSYEWSCDGGQIVSDGSMIGWIAPDASTWVTVTVTVTDVIGNMISETLLLEVVNCAPCTFEECFSAPS